MLTKRNKCLYYDEVGYTQNWFELKLYKVVTYHIDKKYWASLRGDENQLGRKVCN